MVISFLVAVYFEFIHGSLGLASLIEWQKLIIGVAITTAGWIAVTMLTRPADTETLRQFYRTARPWGRSWLRLFSPEEQMELSREKMTSGCSLANSMCSIFLGLLMVYGALFGIGYLLYGDLALALVLFTVSGIAGLLLYRSWRGNRIASFQ
jgi:hypothetical protein